MMKYLLLMCLILLSYVAPAQQQKQEVYYTCPMHPEVKKEQPGQCPKCGMDLVKKKSKAAPAKEHKGHKEPSTPAADSLHAPHSNHGEKKSASRPISSLTAGTPRKVRYDLYITDTIVRYTGKARKAIAINGSIPGPELIFTEGDTAEIHVHNRMHHETSLHWHGVILPNTEDGVPYLTTAPIKGHSTHVFSFPIVQSGTYWYHSHTMLQEQSGMYGALTFKKREEPAMESHTVLLSDWTDRNPNQVERMLHTQSDWFAIKKNSVQSYAEAVQAGSFGVKLGNEWKRMAAMDVSDVYYERFLLNGQAEEQQPRFKKGTQVRLRVINGSSSTYFWLQYGGGKITVVANDGADVVPVTVDRLIVGVSETYDVLVTIPDEGSYEFRATPEDRTGHTSLWLGTGDKKPAPVLKRLDYFEGMKMMNGMSRMNGDMKEMPRMKMSNQVMDMNTVMYPELLSPEPAVEAPEADTAMDEMEHMDHGAMSPQQDGLVTLNYGMLQAPAKTTLPQDWPERIFNFTLTGNMNRYVWSVDNQTISEARRIWIRKGERIRVVLFNNTMMRHPMHLHGHFFRVLNGKGDYAPLKSVLDIMPMERDTIEFAATESGDWFFHCHILYHMMAGMGKIFSYENSPPNPQLPDSNYARRMLYRDDRKFYGTAEGSLESNGSDGRASLSNTRWRLETLWHLGWDDSKGYESETTIGRYFGKMQWWYVYAGFDYHYKSAKGIRHDEAFNLLGQESNKNNRKTVMLGVQYTLPMLVQAEARIDGNGKVRLQLGREDIPISRRLRFSFMGNSDREYMAGFRYILNRSLMLSAHYDSDMGLGGGLALRW